MIKIAAFSIAGIALLIFTVTSLVKATAPTCRDGYVLISGYDAWSVCVAGYKP